MVLVDARSLPIAVTTESASPHESTLVQGLFDFMLTLDAPERIIGDKAYDSDALDDELDDECIQMIAPHLKNRKLEHVTQDGRKLRRYKRRWTVERTISFSRTSAASASATNAAPCSSKDSSTSAAPSSCSNGFTDRL